MSLYGVMRTSTSGMAAQADRLSTVADNIANVNTNGYKRASTEFASLLVQESAGNYNSGAVLTTVRNSISQQGSLINSVSVTDLAINGAGFFVVSDSGGTPYLTRAGSFVASGNGDLVNAAGFKLLAYDLRSGPPEVTVNGYTGLVPVNVSALSLEASPTTSGSFAANLPSEAAITPAGDLPGANQASASFAGKSSLIAYDSLGAEVLLDVYVAKSAASQWEIAVFDKSAAAAGGGFPYSSGPLASTTLTFDAAGKLDAASPDAIDIPVPGGATLALDLSGMSQLATGYDVLEGKVNGHPPSEVDFVEFARDGTVYATYENGTRVPAFRIPLADVPSPDNLAPLSGNVFAATQLSGDVQIGFAESAGFGSILSNSLEQSTVDLAGELTNMIDAQRSYTANSKVFQTGSELMDVLVNLKR